MSIKYRPYTFKGQAERTWQSFYARSAFINQQETQLQAVDGFHPLFPLLPMRHPNC